MKIVTLKETQSNEKRVAITPDIVKRFVKDEHTVVVQSNAGKTSGFSDQDYKDAGAKIAKSVKDTVKGADILVHVQPLSEKIISDLPSKIKTIGLLDPYIETKKLDALKKKKATSIALEFVPRITRAQNMDVLSSQSNLAGYRAVIEGANAYGRAFPMMMTAAGTVAPAKVFVMGAGVAGLQAIATAKRLGAVVSATDIRPAAKEQVESLGGKFVMVENEETKQAETEGGYAKEMSDDYKKKQAELIADTIKKQDIVITTALIPGRPAPELVSADMVKSMKTGSVIVDLAAANGGNCALTEKDKVVEKHGVTIIGYANLPSHVAADTSKLYAKNAYNYISTLFKDGVLDKKDQIVEESLILEDGELVNERLGGKKTKAKAAPKKKTAKKKSTKKKSTTKKKASTSKKKATKKTKKKASASKKKTTKKATKKKKTTSKKKKS